MAGLLQQGMAQAVPSSSPAQTSQPPQPPPTSPQGQPQPGGNAVDMDPGQGPQQREILVSAMLETLYGPMIEQARDILAQHPDQPEQGMARILSQLITVLWKQMQEQGKAIPPGVMVQAAMVAAQAIGEMAIRLGLIDEQDADSIEAAFMIAMGEFGKATAQDMPPEQRQRYAQLIQAITEGKQAAMGSQGAPNAQPEPQGGM